MQLAVSSINGTKSSPIEVSDATFNCEFNEGLVHQVITAYRAKARAGTKAQKSRSEVRGGGAKPWRQKGTGRARAGTTRSPIWTGGGVTFAAKPRDYGQKVNKKVYRRALAAIFSELIRHDRLKVVNELNLLAPKTRELLEVLKALSLENVLIIVDGENRHARLAARNLPGVSFSDVAKLNLVNLIAFDHVLITSDALKKVEEKLS